LRRKYQDQDGVVQRILTEEIWMGETKEQVADTFGTPVAVEEKINRKKAIEVWRYQPAQKNRFGMSITFEDGAVVAWERKR
jgi:outer membrane protein assembly factor BamE (lipoprotein component of BamABCDE complex)